MFRVSTKTHGLLDVLTAGTLMTLPRALGWGKRLTDTLTTVAVGTLGYSLLTDYEYGLIRVLPMRAHLAADVASGVGFLAAPWLFPEEDKTTHAALVGIGLFEIAAGLMTEPTAGWNESLNMNRRYGQGQVPPSSGFAGGLQHSSTSASL